MTVFLAMVLDAYRELNSRKLFWITLGISAFVVLFYASIGFNETGMTMLFGLTGVENELLTHGSPIAAILYRSIFSSVMVSVWLAWIATILALISTTTLFPDFIAGGAIDLVLSKPIGRVRLFFIKYFASLLFVLLQVTLFCVGVFLCVGLRIDDWEWKILLAIPIVTLFYSYLYAVNVFVGVWTRSALAALLATLIFWLSLFGINMSEAMLNQVRTDMVVQIEGDAAGIERIERLEAILPANADDDDPLSRRRAEEQLQQMREQRDTKQELVDKLDAWHARIRSAQFGLPKTSETIALLDRWLKRDTDVNILDIMRGTAVIGPEGQVQTTDNSRHREVERRLEEEYEERSLTSIIGTSLAFEFVVLGLACWVFVRRDY